METDDGADWQDATNFIDALPSDDFQVAPTGPSLGPGCYSDVHVAL